MEFGKIFSFVYSGAPVSRVTLMAPGSGSHGTEFNQRALFMYVVNQTDSLITVMAPLDATVMLAGHHMLFACNGDTCSEAAWVRLTRDEVEQVCSRS